MTALNVWKRMKEILKPCSVKKKKKKKLALSPLACQYYALLGLESIKMDLGIMIQSNEAKLMNERWFQEFFLIAHTIALISTQVGNPFEWHIDLY